MTPRSRELRAGPYDDAGRLTQTNVASVKRGAYGYDLMGRATSQYDYDTDGTTVLYSRTVAYNDSNQVTSDTTDTKRGSTIYRAVSSYTYGTTTSYALGSPLTITTVNYENSVVKKTNLTTNTYQWWDGAVQSVTTYDSDTASSSNPINTSTYAYDNIGGQALLNNVDVADGRSRTVSFLTDFQAHITKRDEHDGSSTNGDPHEIYYRFAGAEMGQVSNNGTIETDYTTSIANRTATQGANAFRNGSNTSVSYADFDQSIDPINSYDQGSAGGLYTVHDGDTLASIAANLWGDSALWYKIAEANGLTGNAALFEGQTLNLPTGVMRATHTAKTFTPYDPNELLGNTMGRRALQSEAMSKAPDLSAPAFEKGSGCKGTYESPPSFNSTELNLQLSSLHTSHGSSRC